MKTTKIIALALSVVTSVSLAATEIRVHQVRTSEDSWPAFFQELVDQKVVAEDETVPVKALLYDVCFRKEVKPYCRVVDGRLEPTELLVAGFQKRNGLPDRVNLTDYRVMAHKGGPGAYLPLPEATVPVPAASAPTAVSAATTSTPVAAVTQETIAQLRGAIAESTAVIDAIKAKMDKMPTSAEMVGLTAKLTAESSARRDLERKLKDELKELATATGKEIASAVAPVARNATAALTGVARVDANLNDANKKADKRFTGLEGLVKGTEKDLRWLTVAVAVFFLLLVGLAFGIFEVRRRFSAFKKNTNDFLNYKNEKEMAMERNIAEIGSRETANATSIKGVRQTVQSVDNRLTSLARHVEEVAGAVTTLEDRMVAVEVASAVNWDFSDTDKAAMIAANANLAAGEFSPPVTLESLPGGPRAIRFEGVDDKCVYIDGVRSPNGQRRPIRRTRIFAVLRGAATRGDLPGVEVPSPADTTPMDMVVSDPLPLRVVA